MYPLIYPTIEYSWCSCRPT